SCAVRSYRTLSPLPSEDGGLLSVALSVGSRPPGVTWRSALWSPDFPPSLARERLPGQLRAAPYKVFPATASCIIPVAGPVPIHTTGSFYHRRSLRRGRRPA